MPLTVRPFSLCFVCTGNICRSPTAEGIVRTKIAGGPLAGSVLTDSAGTHGYHIGEAPDPRSASAAARRGYPLHDLRVRKFERIDFARFDLVLAMDREHRTFLARLAQPSQAHKLKMMMTFSRRFGEIDVPDPYYGGTEGFEHVLDMLEDAADGLLESLTIDIR